MSKPKPQYLVSTDSIGFLGRPEQFIKLWLEFFADGTFDGVEAIAFKPLFRLKNLVSVLGEKNIPVLSFHGKTGGEERLGTSSKIIMTLVNMFILDINEVLDNFPDIEFLSHSHYFEEVIVKKTISKRKPGKFWIENHPWGKEEVEENIKQVLYYRNIGVNALGMFDVYHFVGQIKLSEFLENWGETVNQIENYLKIVDAKGKQLFTGIHFPIGTRLDDSLPIEDMTDGMLKLFAEKIIPHVEMVVFENQQKLPGLFFSTEKMLQEQYQRNKRIIARLKKTGIIY